MRDDRFFNKTHKSIVAILLLTGHLQLVCAATSASNNIASQNDTPAIDNEDDEITSTDMKEARQVATAGMRVYLDPATGKMIENPGEELRRAFSTEGQNAARVLEPTQEILHADGSVSVVLKGRFQMSAMAKVDADGKISAVCEPGHAHKNQTQATNDAATIPTLAKRNRGRDHVEDDNKAHHHANDSHHQDGDDDAQHQARDRHDSHALNSGVEGQHVAGHVGDHRHDEDGHRGRGRDHVEDGEHRSNQLETH